jgi:UDP-N-acetyl-D-mannosaminuronic acid dehydrogenase
MSVKPERIAIVGGCGRVGLPLGVSTALAGFPTTLVDINAAAVAQVERGRFPFLEQDGDAMLSRALAAGLKATTDREACRDATVLIFVTGTPIDEYLAPKVSDVTRVLDDYRSYLDAGDLVIMRSTLCPGTIDLVRRNFSEWSPGVQLSYCPERVAQGFALAEIHSLPQIIAAFDDASFDRSYRIFARIAPSIVKLAPEEAEVAKLVANSWRYLEFAIANQFYMLIEKAGLDFFRIYDAIRHDYPRAATYRSPGLAAGPCLFKDTMQLAGYGRHDFELGHAAVHVNEGLADFIVDKTERLLGGSLEHKTVGILGLAFKADSDDTRTSLSFRVKKGLAFRGAKVSCHDPYVAGGPTVADVIAAADLVVLCTPHREYRNLVIDKPVVDVWGTRDRTAIEILPGTKEIR